MVIVKQKSTERFVLADIENVCPNPEALKESVSRLGTGFRGPKVEEGAKECHWSGKIYGTEVTR
jgi:hypothetical protein